MARPHPTLDLNAMKTSRLLVSLISVLALLTQGCATGTKAKIFSAGPPPDRDVCESAMLAFIDRAKNGDLDGMIALCSKITIGQAGGVDTLRTAMRMDTIPFFRRFSTMKPEGESTVGSDLYGHHGWMFTRTFVAPDGKEAKAEFAISREGSRIVVASLELRNQG